MNTDRAAYEQLITGLMENGFGTIDHFLSPALVTSLRQRLIAFHVASEMKPAGIGQQTSFQNNSEIRRDLIRWIEPNEANDAEKEFLAVVESFVSYLNQTCYTGLNAFEFHYAWYDTGSFYKKHIDQFRSDSGRKYSVVIYLNEQWKDEDGGQLVLHFDEQQVRITPLGGRIVFFESDRIEHEVLPAAKPRLSVTGWLKRI